MSGILQVEGSALTPAIRKLEYTKNYMNNANTAAYKAKALKTPKNFGKDELSEAIKKIASIQNVRLPSTIINVKTTAEDIIRVNTNPGTRNTNLRLEDWGHTRGSKAGIDPYAHYVNFDKKKADKIVREYYNDVRVYYPCKSLLDKKYREYWNKGTGSMTKAEKAEYERYKQNPKKYCKNGNDWETQYYLDHPDVAKKMAANYRKKAQTQTMLNGVLSSLSFGLYNRVDKEKTNYWNNIMTQIKTKETGLDKDVNSYNSKVKRLNELVKKYEKSGLTNKEIDEYNKIIKDAEKLEKTINEKSKTVNEKFIKLDKASHDQKKYEVATDVITIVAAPEEALFAAGKVAGKGIKIAGIAGKAVKTAKGTTAVQSVAKVGGKIKDLKPIQAISDGVKQDIKKSGELTPTKTITEVAKATTTKPKSKFVTKDTVRVTREVDDDTGIAKVVTRDKKTNEIIREDNLGKVFDNGAGKSETNISKLETSSKVIKASEATEKTGSPRIEKVDTLEEKAAFAPEEKVDNLSTSKPSKGTAKVKSVRPGIKNTSVVKVQKKELTSSGTTGKVGSATRVVSTPKETVKVLSSSPNAGAIRISKTAAASIAGTAGTLGKGLGKTDNFFGIGKSVDKTVAKATDASNIERATKGAGDSINPNIPNSEKEFKSSEIPKEKMEKQKLAEDVPEKPTIAKEKTTESFPKSPNDVPKAHKIDEKKVPLDSVEPTKSEMPLDDMPYENAADSSNMYLKDVSNFSHYGLEKGEKKITLSVKGLNEPKPVTADSLEESLRGLSDYGKQNGNPLMITKFKFNKIENGKYELKVEFSGHTREFSGTPEEIAEQLDLHRLQLKDSYNTAAQKYVDNFGGKLHVENIRDIEYTSPEVKKAMDEYYSAASKSKEGPKNIKLADDTNLPNPSDIKFDERYALPEDVYICDPLTGKMYAVPKNAEMKNVKIIAGHNCSAEIGDVFKEMQYADIDMFSGTPISSEKNIVKVSANTTIYIDAEPRVIEIHYYQELGTNNRFHFKGFTPLKKSNGIPTYQKAIDFNDNFISDINKTIKSPQQKEFEDFVDQLDKKIAAVNNKKAALQAAIKDGKNPAKAQKELDKAQKKLDLVQKKVDVGPPAEKYVENIEEIVENINNIDTPIPHKLNAVKDADGRVIDVKIEKIETIEEMPKFSDDVTEKVGSPKIEEVDIPEEKAAFTTEEKIENLSTSKTSNSGTEEIKKQIEEIDKEIENEKSYVNSVTEDYGKNPSGAFGFGGRNKSIVGNVRASSSKRLEELTAKKQTLVNELSTRETTSINPKQMHDALSEKQAFEKISDLELGLKAEEDLPSSTKSAFEKVLKSSEENQEKAMEEVRKVVDENREQITKQADKKVQELTSKQEKLETELEHLKDNDIYAKEENLFERKIDAEEQYEKISSSKTASEEQIKQSKEEYEQSTKELDDFYYSLTDEEMEQLDKISEIDDKIEAELSEVNKDLDQAVIEREKLDDWDKARKELAEKEIERLQKQGTKARKIIENTKEYDEVLKKEQDIIKDIDESKKGENKGIFKRLDNYLSDSEIKSLEKELKELKLEEKKLLEKNSSLRTEIENNKSSIINSNVETGLSKETSQPKIEVIKGGKTVETESPKIGEVDIPEEKAAFIEEETSSSIEIDKVNQLTKEARSFREKHGISPQEAREKISSGEIKDTNIINDVNHITTEAEKLNFDIPKTESPKIGEVDIPEEKTEFTPTDVVNNVYGKPTDVTETSKITNIGEEISKTDEEEIQKIIDSVYGEKKPTTPEELADNVFGKKIENQPVNGNSTDEVIQNIDNKIANREEAKQNIFGEGDGTAKYEISLQDLNKANDIIEASKTRALTDEEIKFINETPGAKEYKDLTDEIDKLWEDRSKIKNGEIIPEHIIETETRKVPVNDEEEIQKIIDSVYGEKKPTTPEELADNVFGKKIEETSQPKFEVIKGEKPVETESPKIGEVDIPEEKAAFIEEGTSSSIEIDKVNQLTKEARSFREKHGISPQEAREKISSGEITDTNIINDVNHITTEAEKLNFDISKTESPKIEKLNVPEEKAAYTPEDSNISSTIHVVEKNKTNNPTMAGEFSKEYGEINGKILDFEKRNGVNYEEVIAKIEKGQTDGLSPDIISEARELRSTQKELGDLSENIKTKEAINKEIDNFKSNHEGMSYEDAYKGIESGKITDPEIIKDVDEITNQVKAYGSKVGHKAELKTFGKEVKNSDLPEEFRDIDDFEDIMEENIGDEVIDEDIDISDLFDEVSEAERRSPKEAIVGKATEIKDSVKERLKENPAVKKVTDSELYKNHPTAVKRTAAGVAVGTPVGAAVGIDALNGDKSNHITDDRENYSYEDDPKDTKPEIETPTNIDNVIDDATLELENVFGEDNEDLLNEYLNKINNATSKEEINKILEEARQAKNNLTAKEDFYNSTTYDNTYSSSGGGNLNHTSASKPKPKTPKPIEESKVITIPDKEVPENPVETAPGENIIPGDDVTPTPGETIVPGVQAGISNGTFWIDDEGEIYKSARNNVRENYVGHINWDKIKKVIDENGNVSFEAKDGVNNINLNNLNDLLAPEELEDLNVYFE